MAKHIKVGVVGCGYWGPNLVRNFRSLPDCSVKMMCDVSEKRLSHLKSLYPEVEGELDYIHMLIEYRNQPRARIFFGPESCYRPGRNPKWGEDPIAAALLPGLYSWYEA
jgi:hypothetical protein